MPHEATARVGRGETGERSIQLQQILRLWLLATVVLLAGMAVWAFVPVLVPVVMIALVLGALVGPIVWVARRIEAARGGPAEPER